MRYLGNKEKIAPIIWELLSKKELLNKGLTFCDGFCGSGSVADYLKGYFEKIIINDNLYWSVIYSHGRICAAGCEFKVLGFDPFDYLNSNTSGMHGFIYENYSPGGSKRMYFSAENAERIDYFRFQIEQWWTEEKLTLDEYRYLLSSLIESVSDVSNTAGVYGAFLKKWDSRALKPIELKRVNSNLKDCNFIQTFNNKIENIITEIDCDVLYLDPPYTQNQYGTQYHLLETLVLNDNPSISAITGSRSTAPMRSDWSKKYKANILFDRLLSITKAKYVLLSYNNDGFMSKDFIEASMKRYGKPESYVCKKISYKKYQNWKSNNQNDHYEYLFFVELKDKHNVRYESPLNYIGSKAKIINDIISYSPATFSSFLDAFGGGFNVGINFDVSTVIYNDINCFVKELVTSFMENDTYQYLVYMEKVIKKFGLEKANTDAYVKARAHYNSLPKSRRDPRLLFTIILYGYQQQIRFNNNHEFNNPVGMRWFNDKVLEKMISFSRAIKNGNYIIKCGNYFDLIDEIDRDTFVYLDPPYKLTTGVYNDGKRGFDGWDEYQEQQLFSFANQLTRKNIKFMLSYVIEHKGLRNNNLINWINENHYKTIELGNVIGISGSRRKEVLIVNYDE